jgi:hypothetical protein
MSKIITIIEIDVKKLTSIFISYEPGIRFATLSPDPAEPFVDTDGRVWFWTNQGSKKITAQAVRIIDNTTKTVIDLFPTSSLVNLRTQPNGFFYDTETTNLFLNLGTGRDISKKYFIDVGQKEGFTDKVDGIRIEKAHYNNLYYPPLLKNAPSIKYNKETLYYGVFKENSINVTFDNNEGFFDDYGRNIFNNTAIIKIAPEGTEYENFETIFNGIVASYSTSLKQFKIKLKSKIFGFTRKLPVNKFTKSEYSFLSDNDVDKPVPLAYGSVIGVEPYIINQENATATDYFYYLAENVSSVEEVRIDGVVYAGYTEYLDEGYISIPTADAKDVDDNFLDVIVDFTGGSANGLTVMRDIITKYIGATYNGDNYDTNQWSEQESIAKDITYFINEKTEIKKIFEKISFAQFGFFDVTKNGKFTFRSFSESAQLKTALLYDDWISDPTRTENFNEFLTSATFKYNKNISTGKFFTLENKVNEDVLLQKYGLAKEKEFEIKLANQSDVEDFSNLFLADRNDILTTYSRTCDLKHGNAAAQFKDIEIMDLISTAHNRNQDDYNVYEITGKSYNIDKEQLTFEMRFLKELNLSDYVKEGFYKCEGDIDVGGIDFNHLVNLDFSFFDETINYYDLDFYNNFYLAPNFCYYSKLYQRPAGFTEIRLTVSSTGGRIRFQYRDIQNSGIIPNFTGLTTLSSGLNIITLPGIQNLQYRIFGVNSDAEIINIIETSIT